MAVEIDAHAGPVEARGDLLDVSRFAGAMIAGDHDAAVVGEAGQDRERRLAVEEVILVEIGDMLVGLGIGRHLDRRIEAEKLADRHFHVGQVGRLGIGNSGHSLWFLCLFATPSLARRFYTVTHFRASAGEARRSIEARRAQIIIGLNHRPELVLVGAAAAVGVRMHALHQGLVLALDLLDIGGLVEPQSM